MSIIQSRVASDLPSTKEIAVDSVICASTFSYAAHLFTSLNPLTGAIYGITYALSGNAFDYGCKKAGIDQNNVTAVAAKFFSQIAIGALVTTAAGFPITFSATIILPIISAGMIVGGAICTIALVFTVAIATRMIQQRCSVKEACRSLLLDQVVMVRERIQEIAQNQEVTARAFINVLNEMIHFLDNSHQVSG